MFADLVRSCRSTRRFRQSTPISRETLLEIVDIARLSASGGNRQPLKYWLSADHDTNALIFPHVAWAGYLTDWEGPAEGERPAAYIIILGDTTVSEEFGIDHGIAAQTIALAARDKGYGACIMASVQRHHVRERLAIPGHLEILLVVALGVPSETIVLEPVGKLGDVKYYRDAEGVHHVPKRSLEDVVVH